MQLHKISAQTKSPTPASVRSERGSDKTLSVHVAIERMGLYRGGHTD